MFFCCLSCSPEKLDTEEVVDLYGREVINYFYETVFHMDRGGGVMDDAYRWKEDIQMSLHGDMLEYDSFYVKEALSEINSLEIPISILIVSDPGKSNMQMYFGNAESVADSLLLDSMTTVGIGLVDNRSGAIEAARIGIVNDAIIYSQINASPLAV